jgi:NAD(P) transhydrogenase subunit alpha
LLIGIPRETCPGERRVAVAPTALAHLKKAKLDVIVESGAGLEAGFTDEAYKAAGAAVGSRADVLKADVIASVRALGANPDRAASDLAGMHEGQALVAVMDPLSNPGPVTAAAKAGIAAFALDLMPRITRAQSMDVLSSQANLAGYKAVLMAAEALAKIFPMMMTAAGTITPARVLVVGAGVAGLQAIATAKRLGAVVSGYDVRAAAKEQVESLGARFVELPLETGESQDSGGYAKAMDERFYQRQAELMAGVVADSDVVITTAAVPGKRAPVIVTRAMVEGMQPGAVIVDLATERGGNCEATVAGQTVVINGVTVMGPLNVPSTVPFHASQLFARNVATFLAHLCKEGSLKIDTEDEITRETLLTQGGEVVHARVRELLGLMPLVPATPADAPEAAVVTAGGR